MTRRMTGLSVGNFKAFGETQKLPFRPITLVYGPNSAGKSSLFQALALAHEAEFGPLAAERPLLDVHQTRLGGNAIDLGGFRQYVHRGQAARRVVWGAELDVDALAKNGSERLWRRLSQSRRVTLSISLGIETDDQDRPKPDADPRVEEIELSLDGAELLRMSRRPAAEAADPAANRFRVDRLAAEHAVFEPLLLEALSQEDKESMSANEHAIVLDEALKSVVPSLLVTTRRFLPTDAEVTIEQSRAGATVSTLLSLKLQEDLPALIEELLVGLSQVVKEEIGTLRYLGPLRSLPPRHLAFTERSDSNRVAGGAWAWDEVRRDDAVREAVNVWLGSSRLKTPYELEVRSLVPVDAVQRIIEDEVAASMDGYSADDEDSRWSDRGPSSSTDLDEGPVPSRQGAESLAKRLADVIAATGLERFREVVLLDKRRNAVVTHRDVGVGISQVLPVLVLCYGSRGAALAMEQPEIHLHPGLQAELGDVFIEAALSDRRNTLLIETHSEHVLLRIMRRIRENFEGRPRQGPSISADDVAILYVEPHEHRSVVREMPLTAAGDLAKSWPGGFFEEGLREQFDA